MMKVSIITVCFNSAKTIEDTLRSVLGQDYENIEYVVVDGGSTDATPSILKKYGRQIHKCISEPDNGVYDAMNKGIALASGDIIATLNSDDIYASPTVVSRMVDLIKANNLDAAYADLAYIKGNDTDNIVRFWKTGYFQPGSFARGWVPPHPTFFCKKDVFGRYGYFRGDYHISADFELMLRFFEKHQIDVGYLPEVIVNMRTGGKANVITGIIKGNCEIFNAFKVNGLRFSPMFFLQKPFTKLAQLFKRPKPA